MSNSSSSYCAILLELVHWLGLHTRETATSISIVSCPNERVFTDMARFGIYTFLRWNIMTGKPSRKRFIPVDVYQRTGPIVGLVGAFTGCLGAAAVKHVRTKTSEFDQTEYWTSQMLTDKETKKWRCNRENSRARSSVFSVSVENGAAPPTNQRCE